MTFGELSLKDIKNYITENKIIPVSAGVLSVYLIIQLFLLQTQMHGYDSYRDLTVVKEIINRGTLSYFGQGYVVNPPLSYLMRASVAKLLGFSVISQKAFSVLMFFGGQILIYLSARNFWDKRKSLYVFLISSLTWSFVMATRIRSFAYMLLFSAFILYCYTRYMTRPSRKTASLVGISLGLGMLTKSSFAFLVVLLSIHHGLTYLREKRNRLIIDYAIMGSVASLLYLPYLMYLDINSLPMPWGAQMMSMTGNAAWMKNYTPPSHFYLYKVLTQYYPVMMLVSLGGAIKFREKLKKKITYPIGFLAIILFLGPLMGRLVLVKVHLYQLFFLFIPLPFLTVWSLRKLAENQSLETDLLKNLPINGKQLLVASLIVFAGIHGITEIQNNTEPVNQYFSESFQEFTSNLEKTDVVLSETQYVQLNALSDAYVEHAVEPQAQRMLTYGADYYISNKKLNKPYLNKKENIILRNQNSHVYKVNRKMLLESMNMTSKPIEIVNSKGLPVSYARCVIAGKNWKMMQISNNAGQVNIISPENYNGRKLILCKAMGYSNFKGPIPQDNKIEMGALTSLDHDYNQTRY